MRRLSLALRALLASAARAVDWEGALILAGIGGLAFIGWTEDWRLGVAIISVSLIVAGIALARPQQPKA